MVLSWVVLIEKMNNNIEATAVASEKKEVVAETASINKSNLEKMEKTENVEVAQTTRIAIIGGEEKEIIIAQTEYGMEQPKDVKDLMGSIDRSKLLSCKFHFAKPELFWNEEIELKDENGNTIEQGTPDVFVLCPTADTYWRIGLEEKIVEPEIHDFTTVEEFAQAIGSTNLYSRGLSNTEKVGVAGLATGNEACKAVFKFAKKHEMNITTAKLYLDCTMKPTTVLEMTMGVTPEKELSLGRKEKEAEKLLEVSASIFKKNAEKRYAIRAINTLLHNEEYTMKQMLRAIKQVSVSELKEIDLVTSDEKQTKITHFLTKHLEKIKSEDAAKNKTEQKEAA